MLSFVDCVILFLPIWKVQVGYMKSWTCVPSTYLNHFYSCGRNPFKGAERISYVGGVWADTSIRFSPLTLQESSVKLILIQPIGILVIPPRSDVTIIPCLNLWAELTISWRWLQSKKCWCFFMFIRCILVGVDKSFVKLLRCIWSSVKDCTRRIFGLSNIWNYF